MSSQYIHLNCNVNKYQISALEAFFPREFILSILFGLFNSNISGFVYNLRSTLMNMNEFFHNYFKLLFLSFIFSGDRVYIFQTSARKSDSQEASAIIYYTILVASMFLLKIQPANHETMLRIDVVKFTFNRR